MPQPDLLRRAHHALCSAFVSEDLFRAAFGAGRGDLSAVAAYLRMDRAARPDFCWTYDWTVIRSLTRNG